MKKDDIILAFGAALQRNAPMADTTLLFARVFVEADAYQVVGFNIGDGLLCAWNENSKSLTTVATAVCTQKGVANFPNTCQNHEIH